MHQEQENLDIIFRHTLPEIILARVRNGEELCDRNLYEHFSVMNLREYTKDEIAVRFDKLKNDIFDSQDNIFALPYKYADKVIELKHNEPKCKQDSMLDWRYTTLRLGQDIFTTSLLAYRDVVNNSKIQRNFIWPAVLKSNDDRLNNILSKGMAENHYHLYGSTQSFALSWTAMMNHPEYIKKNIAISERFEINQNENVSRGYMDAIMPWHKRLLYAAEIRALLMMRCLDICDAEAVSKKFEIFDIFPLSEKVKQETEMLRRLYGYKFKQDNNTKKCLDYANTSMLYFIIPDANTRMLAGERNFLYHCFKEIYMGEFTAVEIGLFYVYILIQTNFRSEIIQSNGRPGFQNFSDYQDRKTQLWEYFKEYWTEGQRLSICAATQQNKLISMETRIAPAMSYVQMGKDIRMNDRLIWFSLNGNNKYNPYNEKENPLPFFYVIHFIKKKYSKKEYMDKSIRVFPRNAETRYNAKHQAIELKKFIQKYDIYNQRIYGIDACSTEIGCRPETFATEFRFLRETGKQIENISSYSIYGHRLYDELRVTYHVGEDFLDVADGLRAIDEAVRFLHLENGDRLGHALALGIDVQAYYNLKQRQVFMPQQDLLDNLVWLIKRAQEFDIDIPQSGYATLENKINELLIKIYGQCVFKINEGSNCEKMNELINLYYESWKLRGDHPDLYVTGDFKEPPRTDCNQYTYFMRDGDNYYRQNPMVTAFCYFYHYDTRVKDNGFIIAEWEVKQWFIDLVVQIQEKMREEIFKKKISIECNPSSNVLIGTFKKYEKHPIFTFNNYIIKNDNTHPNISVSINTDDLGIFDTSLENEYALILQSLLHGQVGKYTDDEAYEYLDYVRENGICMSFRKV